LFSSLSYEILNTANSPRQDYEKTVIYDLTNGNQEKKDALKILKQALHANATKELPEFLNNQEIENLDKADFIIVIGSQACSNGSCDDI